MHAGAEQADEVLGAEDVSLEAGGGGAEFGELGFFGAEGDLRPFLEGDDEIALDGVDAGVVEGGDGGAVDDGVDGDPADILVLGSEAGELVALLGRGVLTVGVGDLAHQAVALSHGEVGTAEEERERPWKRSSLGFPWSRGRTSRGKRRHG